MDIDLSIIANRDGPSECNWNGSYFGDTDRHGQVAIWDMEANTHERVMNCLNDKTAYGGIYIDKPYFLYPQDEGMRYVSIGQIKLSTLFAAWPVFMWFDTRSVLKTATISDVVLTGWTRNYISSSMPNPVTLEIYPFHFKEWDYSRWWSEDWIPFDICRYNWLHPDEVAKLPLLASLTYDPSWSDSTWVQRSFISQEIFKEYIVREGWTKLYITTDRFRQKIPPILNQYELVELSCPIASGTPTRETILNVTWS
ncbi:MAG: hypothetical protein PHQ86_04540 [Dehalococcoidales bacterium]|nr:hypothetical protein [Dehalococcoidales bacterium]